MQETKPIARISTNRCILQVSALAFSRTFDADFGGEQKLHENEEEEERENQLQQQQEEEEKRNSLPILLLAATTYRGRLAVFNVDYFQKYPLVCSPVDVFEGQDVTSEKQKILTCVDFNSDDSLLVTCSVSQLFLFAVDFEMKKNKSKSRRLRGDNNNNQQEEGGEDQEDGEEGENDGVPRKSEKELASSSSGNQKQERFGENQNFLIAFRRVNFENPEDVIKKNLCLGRAAFSPVHAGELIFYERVDFREHIDHTKKIASSAPMTFALPARDDFFSVYTVSGLDLLAASQESPSSSARRRRPSQQVFDARRGFVRDIMMLWSKYNFYRNEPVKKKQEQENVNQNQNQQENQEEKRSESSSTLLLCQLVVDLVSVITNITYSEGGFGALISVEGEAKIHLASLYNSFTDEEIKMNYSKYSFNRTAFQASHPVKQFPISSAGSSQSCFATVVPVLKNKNKNEKEKKKVYHDQESLLLTVENRHPAISSYNLDGDGTYQERNTGSHATLSGNTSIKNMTNRIRVENSSSSSSSSFSDVTSNRVVVGTEHGAESALLFYEVPLVETNRSREDKEKPFLLGEASFIGAQPRAIGAESQAVSSLAVSRSGSSRLIASASSSLSLRDSKEIFLFLDPWRAQRAKKRMICFKVLERSFGDTKLLEALKVFAVLITTCRFIA